jgi:phenylpropionate dioxygenase-like ring-hydroxylating dioxygenase large terminal subunit
MTITDVPTGLDRLRIDVAGGRIPKDRYLSADLWRLEQERVWKKVWQWACLEDDLPDPGSYVEHQIGDQSILVLRGDDGQIRAFHNVCLHRGNRLRSGTGTAKTELACPYHRWTWDLRGDLRHVPDREGFPAFDDACFSLNSVRCETWEGFVFVNLDRHAEPLLGYLAPLTERLAPYHFGRHTRTRSVTMPLAANWKTIVDGFVDVYHLQGVHPQLLKFLDDVNTTYEILGRHSAMYMPMGVASPRLADHGEQVVLDELAQPRSGFHGKLLRRSRYFEERDGHPTLRDGVTVRQALLEVGREEGIEHGFDYSGLSDEQMVDDHHYFFFPNLVVNVYAGHFIAARIRPDAVDPERCFFDMYIFNCLTDEERATRVIPRHAVAEEDSEVGRVPDQDFTALPKVQRGLHSDGLDSLLLSAQEVRVLHFHEVLDEYLFGA